MSLFALKCSLKHANIKVYHIFIMLHVVYMCCAINQVLTLTFPVLVALDGFVNDVGCSVAGMVYFGKVPTFVSQFNFL